MPKDKETASFKSFAELGRSLGQKEPAVETKDPAKELFNKVLAGKFDKAAKGNFEFQALPPITSVTFLPFHNEATGQRILYATIFYVGANNKEGQTTWSIFENGVISGKMPPDLLLQEKRKEIELGLLSRIEKVNLEFWHQTEVPIGLEEDEGQKRELPGEGKGGGAKRKEDPERMEFYVNLPGVLFGAIPKSEGFDGYKLIVFKGDINDFFILDKEFTKNAAFILDLPPEQRLQFENTVSEQEREMLLREHWLGLRSRASTRKQMVEILGARKIVHNKTWKERMRQEIEKRVGSQMVAMN